MAEGEQGTGDAVTGKWIRSPARMQARQQTIGIVLASLRKSRMKCIRSW